MGYYTGTSTEHSLGKLEGKELGITYSAWGWENSALRIDPTCQGTMVLLILVLWWGSLDPSAIVPSSL